MAITQEQELLGNVISKAWEDAQFKQELIANPVAAIEKLTGRKIEIPEGKTLVVRDQTDQSTVYINIPAKPENSDAELTEDQLESVSGGVIGRDGGGCIPVWPPKTTWPPKEIIFTAL